MMNHQGKKIKPLDPLPKQEATRLAQENAVIAEIGKNSLSETLFLSRGLLPKRLPAPARASLCMPGIITNLRIVSRRS